jgi:hypothetical protein
MRKAMTDDQVQGLSDNYTALSKSWGMTDNQAGGAWIGAAFENQNQHLEFKHTRFDSETGAPSLNYEAFTNEVYEKKGSYPLAQMSAHTVEQLKKSYDNGDEATKNKVRSIAETFTFRSGGGQGVVEEGGALIPLQTPGGRTGEPGVSAPGAAHINEVVQDLYRHVNPQGPRQIPGQDRLPGV